MKFDNIINNHGKIEREVVDWNLRNLGNKLFGARDWKFIDGYDSIWIKHFIFIIHKQFI